MVLTADSVLLAIAMGSLPLDKLDGIIDPAVSDRISKQATEAAKQASPFLDQAGATARDTVLPAAARALRGVVGALDGAVDEFLKSE